jgi:hypothetical protein
MFVYNYRCFDRYRKPVISLAVLGDERPNWRPSSYGYDLGGCRVGIEFPIAKLIDYEAHWEELDQNRNPFVIVVMAHLKTKATAGQPQQRKHWKWTLVLKLFEQGYSESDAVELFRLVSWMMTLPDNLEREFLAELRQYKEDRQMPYVTSIERLIKEEGQREIIENILKVRFGALDEQLASIVAHLLTLSPEEYTRLLLELSREDLLIRFSQPES